MPSFIRFFFFFLSHLADSFIFASHQTKKYYKNLIPKNKKNFLIQSPVDTNYFDPEKKYPAAMARMGIDLGKLSSDQGQA